MYLLPHLWRNYFKFCLWCFQWCTNGPSTQNFDIVSDSEYITAYDQLMTNLNLKVGIFKSKHDTKNTILQH